ncbi:hypothetical protein V1477_015332 [Vespula maculifrons]|uniref:Uncharacterized protein n=1 Tax=Vespula maculifrons TaxID=7453 RepID=A0ABD2BFJ2_VESMC
MVLRRNVVSGKKKKEACKEAFEKSVRASKSYNLKAYRVNGAFVSKLLICIFLETADMLLELPIFPALIIIFLWECIFTCRIIAVQCGIDQIDVKAIFIGATALSDFASECQYGQVTLARVENIFGRQCA